jgi:transposase-like protein/IS1 family transposase
MILATCTHESTKKHGKDYKGDQRFRCRLCCKTWVEEQNKPLGRMQTSVKDAATVLSMLLEGMSIRSTSRLTGIDRNTIGDLILTVGENCQRLLDAKIRGVQATDVELDEIWSFVGCKEKTRVARGYSADMGDSWTFIAVERHTKLVLGHKVGQRDSAACVSLLRQLDKATVGRFQLSTDALGTYRMNVPFVLGSRVAFGQMIKVYSSTQETTRYSPAKIISSERRSVFGPVDMDRIGTSRIERLNGTVRQSLRRFTRLTFGHSKSLKHHVAMQAIFFAWYNLCRPHMALDKKTPAMASGLTDKAWTIRELLERAAEA